MVSGQRQLVDDVNLAYNKAGFQIKFVFLVLSKDDFLKVANTYEGNSELIFSVNMKYT